MLLLELEGRRVSRPSYADAGVGEPLEDCQTDELRPVVRAQEERSAVLANEASEDLDETSEAGRTRRIDCQAPKNLGMAVHD